jgi:hypothetical protein
MITTQDTKDDFDVPVQDQVNVNLDNAKTIARKFLGQYFARIIFRGAFLKGNTWIVIMDVGRRDEYMVHVRIDACTGMTLEYL